MWGPSRCLRSPQQPRVSSLSSSDRKQRKNHTSKLQELSLLLPLSLKTGTKKLTKKEILLHVLHYIQYLQRSINVAKALLKFHTTDGKGGLGGLGWNPAVGPARQRHTTPSSSPQSQKSCLQGACQKPRKKMLTQKSEHQTRAQKPHHCLALDRPEKEVTPFPDQKGGNVGRTTTPPQCPNSCRHLKAASPLFQDGRRGGRSWLTSLKMAENSVHCASSGYCRNGAQDDGPCPAIGVQEGAEWIHFLNLAQPCQRQKLVFCDSNDEVEKQSPDADPWLPAWTPEGTPNRSPLTLRPPQIRNWSGAGHPREILGLSPSLFSSPGKLLPKQILEDGTEYLTQALFEEVYLEPNSPPPARTSGAPQKQETLSEAPRDSTDSHSLFPSSISLDHCCLSLSENSRAPSSPSSGETETESMWRLQEANPAGLQSSSDEDGDYTWTPTRRATALPPAGRKARRGLAGRDPRKPKETKKVPCTTQMKKKCVNGFIMFCRMNRKQYIRACPGTASTAATKELAQLWRVMTQKERKPYCVKARRFSRQHNRIVKHGSSSSEDEDGDTPKPFCQLLAKRACCPLRPASALPPQQA